jgi:hypothetical protein
VPELAWVEELRRDLSNRQRPSATVLEVRCANRHPLLWIIRAPGGRLVPLTRTTEDRDREDANAPTVSWVPSPEWPVAVERRTDQPARPRRAQHFHWATDEAGEPRSLKDWPADQLLPPSSCQCHQHVEFTPAQVKGWLGSARREVVYRPETPNM